MDLCNLDKFSGSLMGNYMFLPPHLFLNPFFLEHHDLLIHALKFIRSQVIRWRVWSHPIVIVYYQPHVVCELFIGAGIHDVQVFLFEVTLVRLIVTIPFRHVGLS